ncbi:MAG: ATP phosphoribosyltransferase regulatory subunit [Rhodobacteraceae bacterium]|nr:ATP phosphoribosyltransferase regulatory subunit [Paracoccaceae bacterium]
MQTPGPERARSDRLADWFVAKGATRIEADILQPAETLLDLYGEDIRARAYITADPLRGEMMLRPDFTVPVVQQHMTGGAEPAIYAYSGPVFRKQDRAGDRPSEYHQAGIEVFRRDMPEQSDALVFSLINQVLAENGLHLRPVIGDIGILMAAVRGLATTDRRKQALLRHIWRPHRFRALLDRFSGRAPMPAARKQVLDRLGQGSPADLIAQAGAFTGLRSADEITARAEALIEDARTRPLAAPEAALLYDLLSLQAPSRAALDHLRGITPLLPAITPAVDRFAARLTALSSHGIDVETLPFEASHGRTSLEYYDGFVFSFLADDPSLPPVASGGRYDALTAVLGQGKSIPAVGGVIRAGLFACLQGGKP